MMSRIEIVDMCEDAAPPNCEFQIPLEEDVCGKKYVSLH